MTLISVRENAGMGGLLVPFRLKLLVHEGIGDGLRHKLGPLEGRLYSCRLTPPLQVC
ncbi:hypothetical protein CT19431_40078 [Cupriavidus taiwanensis]|nr:hypothetical protein CT19431_40078 [Cupriavidus taiwanensis]